MTHTKRLNFSLWGQSHLVVCGNRVEPHVIFLVQATMKRSDLYHRVKNLILRLGFEWLLHRL